MKIGSLACIDRLALACRWTPADGQRAAQNYSNSEARFSGGRRGRSAQL